MWHFFFLQHGWCTEVSALQLHLSPWTIRSRAFSGPHLLRQENAESPRKNPAQTISSNLGCGNQDVPTLAEVQDGPALAEIQDGRTLAEVQDGPTLAEVQDGPALAEVQDGPALAEVQDCPTLAKVQDDPAPSEVQSCPVPSETHDLGSSE